MSIAPDLIDPFHRELYAKLQERLLHRVQGIAHGTANATTDDVATTAEKYAAQVSYIQALTDVLELCEDIERDRYGARKREDDE